MRVYACPSSLTCPFRPICQLSPSPSPMTPTLESVRRASVVTCCLFLPVISVDMIRQFLQQGQNDQVGELGHRDGHQAVDAPPVSARGIVPSASFSQSRPIMRTASIPRILAEAQNNIDTVLTLADTMGEDINELQEMRDEVEDMQGMRDDVETLMRKVATLEEAAQKRAADDEAAAQKHAAEATAAEEAAPTETAVAAAAVPKRVAKEASWKQLVVGSMQKQSALKVSQKQVGAEQNIDAIRYVQLVDNIMVALHIVGVAVGFVIAYFVVIVFGPGPITVGALLAWIAAMLALRGYRFRF
ncbi:hypothetical protein PENSPDRAFT_307265 [Peniophora sp. CONT]|nr:hypothetical protein PENSPDRAFT_307265 [Peniophora sp. CONT]